MKEIFEKYENSINELYGLFEVLYNSLYYSYLENYDETYNNSYLLDIIKEKFILAQELYEELLAEYFNIYEREEFEKNFEDGSYFKQND